MREVFGVARSDSSIESKGYNIAKTCMCGVCWGLVQGDDDVDDHSELRHRTNPASKVVSQANGRLRVQP
ncbi:hypothetical protein RRF57_005052 [Xylaria bambusicola]|uniref:Uncharacterized protein n=1 Tax=Xylaria bambusicola TaxID=326684 RepID=A0AAN7UIY0_9PEZI